MFSQNCKYHYPPEELQLLPVTNQTKDIKQSDHKVNSRQHYKPPMPTRTSNKLETEHERRKRKKREFEKKKEKEKPRQKLNGRRESRPRGSVSASRKGDNRTKSLLSGDRAENRLKKPTTFLCRLKFRDNLPDTTAQPKLLSLRREKDRAAKCTVTSLGNVYKPQFNVDRDLGIPLDLLDLSVYNAPKHGLFRVAPEDEILLQEDVSLDPIRKDGLKRKERPTDKLSWLVKTQYVAAVNTVTTRQSLTGKQAGELRETSGLEMLDSMNSRERKIQDIVSSFAASKSHPVHATNKKLQPVEILPLFPDFERRSDQFVVASFDGAPTADSESYNKMDNSIRDAHESQAIMKSFVASTSGSAKSDRFLAYMVPSVGELSKDIYDENKVSSYTWVREYHWDVRGEGADDPTNYLVAFGESEARYMPLPTKLMLRKKRARGGKTSDESELFPVPSSVTIRQRSKVSVDMNASESNVSSKEMMTNARNHGRMEMEDGQQKGTKDDGDMYQSSGAESMSE